MKVLEERGKRYGIFADQAKISSDLKMVMRFTDGWSNLSHSKREALEMIAHKIARILNGDSNYDDNWIDIAGYATLIEKEINGKKI